MSKRQPPVPGGEIRCPLCDRRINPGDALKVCEGDQMCHARCGEAKVRQRPVSRAPTYREVRRG